MQVSIETKEYNEDNMIATVAVVNDRVQDNGIRIVL